MCIVFKLGLCLGCNGFEENIDEVKKYCEHYQKFMKGEFYEQSSFDG